MTTDEKNKIKVPAKPVIYVYPGLSDATREAMRARDLAYRGRRQAVVGRHRLEHPGTDGTEQSVAVAAALGMELDAGSALFDRRRFEAVARTLAGQ